MERSASSGLFALVLGIDGSAMMIGFFVLIPFGICAGGTVIGYEPRPEESVEVPIQAGANRLDLYARLVNDAQAVSIAIRHFGDRYTRGSLSN